MSSTVGRTIWYQGSPDPNAAQSFQDIQSWWSSLNGQEIIWQQRMLSGIEDLSSLDWKSQRFDERFYIKNPEIKGITLYWAKANQPDQVQSTTPQRLELDWEAQQLYVFPQKQQGLVLCITNPTVVYQTVAIKNPQIRYAPLDEYHVLTLQAEEKKLKVQVVLSPEALLQLKAQLPSDPLV